MTEFVRVRDLGTGHEVTLTAARAADLAAGVEVLAKPATFAGYPLPPKARRPLGVRPTSVDPQTPAVAEDPISGPDVADTDKEF